jgi:TolB-like protein
MNPAVIASTGALPRARRSIAVLGFRNVSGRSEEGWLSTALFEN